MTNYELQMTSDKFHVCAKTNRHCKDTQKGVYLEKTVPEFCK
jgi:hypothetical protein